MRRHFFYLILAVLSASPALAQSKDAEAHIIPTRLDCGPLLPSAKLAAFTSPISFTFHKGALKAERTLTQNRGTETYRGTIDPLGRIKISGTHEGENAWELQFSGQLSDTKLTVLNGKLDRMIDAFRVDHIRAE